MNYGYTADLKYAKLVAKKANLGLVVDHHNPQPRTDGNAIYLPPLDPTWDRKSFEYKDWWYSLLHECFHNLHPEDFTLIKDKKVDTKSFLGTILNLALDYKIETVNRGEFVGRDHLVHEARYMFAKDKIYANFGKGDDPKGLRARLEAVWVMDAICRIPWIPEYKRDDVPGLLDRDGAEWYVKLMQDPQVFSMYQNQQTTKDSWAVTMRIFELLEIDPDDPEMNSAPPPAAGDEPQESWVKFSEMISDDHSPTGPRGAGLHIDYDELPPAAWVPMPIEKVEPSMRGAGSDEVHEAERLRTMCAEVNLSKKIRRELQSMSRTRFEGGKKRGRIRARSLFKAQVQNDPKVMKQRVVKFNPKSTIAMTLTDFSGSMIGDKIMHASVATHELARVLHALQISNEVHGFSTKSRQINKLITLKKRGESFNSDEFINRAAAGQRHMHCNADGDFLLWAGSQLMRQKAQRKILFVLSDGQPAAQDVQGHRGIYQFTEKVVKDLERMGIEVYAIGIEDRTVLDLYKHAVVINNSRELEAQLLNVMRNKLLAGMV